MCVVYGILSLNCSPLEVIITPLVISVVYSVGPPEIVDPLIYDGLVEELVEVLEIKDIDIMVSGRGSVCREC